MDDNLNFKKNEKKTKKLFVVLIILVILLISLILTVTIEKNKQTNISNSNNDDKIPQNFDESLSDVQIPDVEEKIEDVQITISGG